MAGHSKWKQIKHKKAVTDARKGQLFSKLVKEVTVAARTGGVNPETNTRLRSALERAKSEGLPKENVERALERASGGTDGPLLQEFLYEATAGGGVQIIIEGITDNKNRTLAEIRHILSEHGGRFAESGSLLWNFEKIGTLEISEEENRHLSKEGVEEAVIDSGADNFTFGKGTWLVETKFAAREDVRKELEKKNVKTRGSGHDFKPRNTLALWTGETEDLESLLDALSEQGDVQEIYTNLQDK